MKDNSEIKKSEHGFSNNQISFKICTINDGLSNYKVSNDKFSNN